MSIQRTLRTLFRHERRYFIASVIVSRLFLLLNGWRKIYPKSILVVKLDEIGDMATSTHVFALLRRSYPEAHITVLCNAFVAPLIEEDPHIDAIITSAKEWVRRYDVVVELRGNWSTLRKCFEHRPRLRLDRATIRLRNKFIGGQRHEVVTNEQIVAPILTPGEPLTPRIYPTQVTRTCVLEFLNAHALTSFAIIAPGARLQLKRWPSERFIEIAQWLRTKHGLTTVCCGGPEDRALIDTIVKASNGAAIPAPATFSLLDFAALCERASVFLGNDSGPMHIAASFSLPLVGIFGSTEPNIFGPLGDRSIIVHHSPCINLATVDEVKEALASAMAIP